MFLPDLVVRSRRVVTPRGARPAAIHVRQGKIIGVVGPDEVPADCAIDEAGDAAVLPGVVDACARLAGGLERATQAAAAGGVTTVVAVSPALDATAATTPTQSMSASGGACRQPTLPRSGNGRVGVLGFVCGPAAEADLRLMMSAVRRLDGLLMVSDVRDTESDIPVRVTQSAP
jgi:hypothetical protein